MLTRMDNRYDGLYINNRKLFSPKATLKISTVEETLKFAYNMSFGKEGEHRGHRSGGSHLRKNGEIFANTFQGKLSEFAVYNVLYNDFTLPLPDLDTYGLGEWDDTDFEIDHRKVSVKSTKSFGNLLLLETKDWNKQGQYIPNLSKGYSEYDFFIFVRIQPFCEDILKKMRSLYSNEIDFKLLSDNILSQRWQYDIPGFITKDQLIFAINNNFIIRQGQMLNGKTRMDAENYYIQAGDMIDIQQFKNYF